MYKHTIVMAAMLAIAVPAFADEQTEKFKDTFDRFGDSTQSFNASQLSCISNDFCALLAVRIMRTYIAGNISTRAVTGEIDKKLAITTITGMRSMTSDKVVIATYDKYLNLIKGSSHE